MSKFKKKRPCPTLDKEIDSTDCGANRHSRYSCPASCQFSPFNPDNYDQLLEIEEKLDNTLFQRGIDNPYFEKLLGRAARKNEEDEFVLTGNFVQILHKERDENGLALRDHWEKTGYRGLKNDHKFLLGCKDGIRISMIEIQQIIDSQTVTVVDLLDDTPQPKDIVDRSLAAIACRFQTMLTYVYKTPFFDRIHGTIYIIPDIPNFTAVETLQEIVDHLGGEKSREWLLANADKITEVWNATSAERHRRFLLNSQIKTLEAEYTLSAPPETVAAKLLEAGLYECDLSFESAQKGIIHIFEALEFDAESAPAEEKGNAKVLGSIEIYPGNARLFATSNDSMALIRQTLESALGTAVEFGKEIVQDVSSQAAERQPEVNSALIPPKLLGREGKMDLFSTYVEKPSAEGTQLDSMNAYLNSHYKRLLDTEIPDLGNLTPRQAAIDPHARPRLVHWTKRLICQNDSLNLEKGTTLDLDWLTLELGLEEINFPPPPPRQRPEHFLEEPYERENYPAEEDEDFEDDLDTKQVHLYLSSISAWLDTLDSIEDAYREMQFSGCNLMQRFSEEAGDILTKDTLQLCKPLFAMIWYAYAGEFEKVELKPGSISTFLDDFFDSINDILEYENSDIADNFSDVCDDPELYVAVSEMAIGHPNLAGLKQSLEEKEQANLAVSIIVAINAVWDETVRL